jgi:hypothetical protein
MESSQGLRESNMPIDDQDRHRPEPVPSDSILEPPPVTAKPDRATYEAWRPSVCAANGTLPLSPASLRDYPPARAVHRLISVATSDFLV